MAVERSPRTPEPELVMDDEDQVAAYTRAGREDGVMAPVYLFHTANVCEVIAAGDTVVDLACGPATQLVQVARLNSDARFIGVDLSKNMLDRAHEYVESQRLSNVEFREGSIDGLGFLNDASVDVVMSTMALHHLPDVGNLIRTFSEVARVLRKDGGVYMVDFGHLKSEKSIRYFAHQYADRQPELFTQDYLNSLHAAFSLADFKVAVRPLSGRAKLYSTFLAPYMVAIKSKFRRSPDTKLHRELRTLKDALPLHHQTDFKDLITFFKLGGMNSPLLSWKDQCENS